MKQLSELTTKPRGGEWLVVVFVFVVVLCPLPFAGGSRYYDAYLLFGSVVVLRTQKDLLLVLVADRG